jgi:hypothetical protein
VSTAEHIDSSAAWPVGRLVGWTVGRLGRSVGRSVGRVFINQQLQVERPPATHPQDQSTATQLVSKPTCASKKGGATAWLIR